MKRILVIVLLGVLTLTSCKPGGKTSEETNSPKEISRYEVDLFGIDTNSFESGLKKIFPKYKVFLGQQMPDQAGIEQLKSFVTDPMIRETYAYTMQQYPDLQWLNTSFNKAFLNMKEEMPEIKIPNVYTYISGFDIQMPVKYTDTALIIGLDLYLGKNYSAYKELGYPLYIINRLDRNYILPDSFKEIAWAHLPEVQGSTLLDAMIEQGKIIYFSELMLPDSKPGDLMKYTEEQYNWVVSNEQNLWTFIIDNQLLYSADPKALTMFMTDGPFTSGFSESSPSRTGYWLGWQIVRNYMQKNDISINELLKETDSQKILEQSGYKPAKV